MDFIKKITRKELFKIASLNSVSVLLKIVTGFVSSKIIAVFVGPSGMALVGNFRNFLSSVETVGTLGFQNGIIKYVAEHENEHKQLQKTLSTVVMILLPVVLSLCLSFWLFSDELNAFLFGKDQQYNHLLGYLSLALPFYIASIIMMAVLNGFGRFKKVVFLNIIGNLLGVVCSIVLVVALKTEGALIALFLVPSLLFFVTLFYLKNACELVVFKREYFDFSMLKNFFEYSLMALASSIVGPMISVFIRKKIITDIGMESAGYWEAMTRISDFYFLFLGTLLTVYFLPKLSKANDRHETGIIFKSYYKRIIPLFAVGLVLVYFLRMFIVRLMLAKSFMPMTDLFFWRCIGDFFKALSLILGYQFLAKKLTKAFIITELLSWATMFGSTSVLISVFGLQGAVMGYAGTYFVYFLVLVVLFRKSLFFAQAIK